VAHLRDVYLYTVDDLRNTIEENMRSRQEAAKQAEEIIDIEVSHFLNWLRSQGATSTIRDLRTQAEQLRDEALFKALQDLKRGQDPQQILEVLASQLTNKLTHLPSTQLKHAGIHERHDLIAAARELFQLKDPN